MILLKILMVALVILKALDFIDLYIDDPAEALYEIIPWIIFIIGLIIILCE